MPTQVVQIDGVLREAGDAVVSVLDRGFLFGDSVFEVFRTYGGVPFRLEAHLDRLEGSARRVMIPMPVARDVLRAEIERAIEAMGEGDLYVRVVVTRGSGPLGFDLSTAEGPVRIVIAQPVQPPPAELYERGVGAATVPWGKNASPAAGAKDSNYLANLLAAHHARERGAYEAILIGPGGEVLEGASSNLFVVRGGLVRTPPLSLGILAGITRSVVFEAAAREGVGVGAQVLFPHDLYDAEEAFLTSSIRELVPVVAVDGVPVGRGEPGALTRRLHAAYRRLVAAGTAGGRAPRLT